MPTRVYDVSDKQQRQQLRPHKRQRVAACIPSISLRHPLGIKPSGNALLSNVPSIRPLALGRLSLLSDDLVLHICSLLQATDLCRLSGTSKALYAFTRSEGLWRDLFLQSSGGTLKTWAGSWRSTYALQICSSSASTGSSMASPIRVCNLFSDTLYNSFRAATVPMLDMLDLSKRAHVPIKRIKASEYTPARFAEDFSLSSTPCIIVGDMEVWPCRAWTLDELRQRWPKRVFQAEALRTTLGPYVAYCRSVGAHAARARGVTVPKLPGPSLVPDVIEADVNPFDPYTPPDEAPYYLFDSEFASDELAAPEWRVPPLLHTTSSGSSVEADLFSLLGDKRPDYRWIIAGPERSGSGWHKDPNHTSAWNVPVSGSKAWLLLPPSTPPPGVYVSADEAEVTSPLSLGEWIADFLDETRRRHGPSGDGTLREGVCGVGETMYVPAGWWHLVINLEESVALTQNFVSTVELPSVLHFMRYKPSQLSGFKNTNGCVEDGDDTCAQRGLELFELFCSRLKAYDPEVLQVGLRGMECLREKEVARDSTSMRLAVGKKRRVAGDVAGVVMTGDPGKKVQVGWWESLKGGSTGGLDEDKAEVGTSLLGLKEDELDEVPW